MTGEDEPTMCGYLVHGDPGAPCTKEPGHGDWWHTHDSAQMPRTSPTEEQR